MMKYILFLVIFTLNICSEDLGYLIFDFNQTNRSILTPYDNEKIDFILDIKNKNYKHIKNFIFKYENIDFPIKDNNTPLFYAIDLGNLKIVKLLIDHGANIYHVNDNRETALHIAVKGSHIEITRFLLEEDVRLNSKDNLGNTALFYAKKNASNELIELLNYYKKNQKEEIDNLEEFIKKF